jgi:hypothetical protein
VSNYAFVFYLLYCRRPHQSSFSVHSVFIVQFPIVSNRSRYESNRCLIKKKHSNLIKKCPPAILWLARPIRLVQALLYRVPVPIGSVEQNKTPRTRPDYLAIVSATTRKPATLLIRHFGSVCLLSRVAHLACVPYRCPAACRLARTRHRSLQRSAGQHPAAVSPRSTAAHRPDTALSQYRAVLVRVCCSSFAEFCWRGTVRWVLFARFLSKLCPHSILFYIFWKP